MASLDGMRVLDMTQYEAGPSCAQYLAWLGADVIKIERPTGDAGRYTGKGLGKFKADPQYFMNYNGNKRSVVLDLRQPKGREAFLELVGKADVLVENFGPGVIEGMGLTDDVLRPLNPRLIYVRIKGFGLSGPYKDYNAYDWVAQAAAGSFSTTGDPDGPPMIVGPTIGDSGTGIQAALGVAAAYVEQQRTGLGQMIEISMQEAVTMFMRTLDPSFWEQHPAERHGVRRGRAGGGLYPCKGDQPTDWVFIFPATTQMIDALCIAIGRPELLEDSRFCTPAARAEHSEEFREVIQEWTLRHDKLEVMEIIAGAGCPASYVFDTEDLFTDPHLKARGFIQYVDHPENGRVPLMRHPLRMRGAVKQGRSPLLGEHTDEVLAEVLGYDQTRLDALRADGVTVGRLLS